MKRIDDNLEEDFDDEDERDDEDEEVSLELEKPNLGHDIIDELNLIKKPIRLGLSLDAPLNSDDAVDKAHYYFNLGFNDFEKENYYSAVESFTTAIELDSNYTAPYHYRGLCRCELRDFSEGIADLSHAISLHSEVYYDFIADVYYDRGIAHYKNKQLEKAVDDFHSALEIAHEYIHCYYAIGCVLNEQKNWVLALDSFEHAIKLYEDKATPYFDEFHTQDKMYYEAGKSAYKSGYVKKSFDYFKKAYTINPTNEKMEIAYKKVKKILESNK